VDKPVVDGLEPDGRKVPSMTSRRINI